MKLQDLFEAKLEGAVEPFGKGGVFGDLEGDVFYTLLVDYGDIPHDAPGFKHEMVPVSDLIPTQKNVDGLKSKNPYPVVVAKRDGKYYIIDGHHRYARDKKAQAKKIECVVISLPHKPITDLAWFEKKLGMKLTRDRNGIVRPGQGTERKLRKYDKQLLV